MKKYLYYSVAALALASCSSDSFFGTDAPPRPDNEEEVAIVFGNQTGRPTRAGQVEGAEAAAKLNNNFIVYGFKYKGAEAIDGTTKDPVVFDLYNVNYEDGTAGTTESNTKNWEYVGNDPHQGSSESEQTIKYWDYESDGYIFSAVSGLGIEATKTKTGTSEYDKGWKVNIPAGGDLSTLYASDRNPVAKADFGNTVTLTFRALGTKVRFAMYETVPGYSVHVDKFYYDNTAWKNTETNFAINGTFKNANASAATPLTVTYYDDASGIENRPKVTYNDAEVTTGKYGIFGANIQAPGQKLGTTSPEATYDQEDKSYTIILPYENDANILELYVDYTLTSTGGSGEQIKVKHASAKVPANYTQWKPNFAYTYIFKISDNTNGTTGDPNDPDDPTSDPTDPKGLFPITFDAAVITEETDLQETITTVSEPSITTYAMGKIVTENDEYTAGPVYYTIMNKGVLMNTAGGVSKVYEVNNFTPNSFEQQVTEEVVANYLNNFCVLTEVPVDFADNVPLNNGTNLTFDHGKCLQFNAEAGKTYAIMYDYNDGTGWKKAYKVVKVTGSKTAPTFTLATSAANLTATDAEATLTLNQGTTGVLGAAPCFKVTSSNDNNALKIVDGANPGEYTVSIDQDAIKAGKANATYTVAFGTQSVTIKVNIAYALYSATLNIEAGASANTQLRIGGVHNETGVVTDVPEGITITPKTTYYQVAVASTVPNGAYTAKIAGQTLNINVTNYQFDAASYVFNMTTAGALVESTTVTLQTNGATPATATGIAASAITIDPAIGLTLTGTAGVYTVGATVNGTYTLTKANTAAKATVTINKYAINSGSIDRSTGRFDLDVTVNGKAVNASASKVKITKDADSSDQTANFTVTTNGKKVVINNAKSTLDAGAYTIHYYLETAKTNEVATSALTVN